MKYILTIFISLIILVWIVACEGPAGPAGSDAILADSLPPEIEWIQPASGEVIDSAREAEIAGDTVREHRHGIAPTYGDLLGEEKFNPTNPQQLTYAQALNLENYLYLAVLGFGVTQVVIGSGAFMVITGLALGGTGTALLKLNK